MDAASAQRDEPGLLLGTLGASLPDCLRGAPGRTRGRMKGRAGDHLPWALRRKRRAAAAGLGGVRVHELEATPVEAIHVVDLEPLQVFSTSGVDAHLDTLEVEQLVTLLGLVVEVQLVAEPRAAAADDGHPEGMLVGESFSGADLAH